MLVDCAGTERKKDSMYHSKEPLGPGNPEMELSKGDLEGSHKGLKFKGTIWQASVLLGFRVQGFGATWPVGG